MEFFTFLVQWIHILERSTEAFLLFKGWFMGSRILTPLSSKAFNLYLFPLFVDFFHRSTWSKDPYRKNTALKRNRTLPRSPKRYPISNKNKLPPHHPKKKVCHWCYFTMWLHHSVAHISRILSFTYLAVALMPGTDPQLKSSNESLLPMQCQSCPTRHKNLLCKKPSRTDEDKGARGSLIPAGDLQKGRWRKL